MDSWHSYPKVFAIGHKALTGLLDGHVVVQEKLDGSQLSFGIDHSGKIWIRSRGRVFDIDAADSLFGKAAESVKLLASQGGLVPGWTYRGEYLAKPKHNALAYQRTPARHIILFDVSTGAEEYLSRERLEAHATALGLEVVPYLWEGPGSELTPMVLDMFLAKPSILGGMIEGVVVKNYAKFTFDGKAMFGKHVSEKFKEVHKTEWTKENPAPSDILQELGDKYRTEARWIKAVQHLRERGELKGGPEDIGPLMKEAKVDLATEEKDAIKDALWRWAVKRGLVDKTTRGLPEWYKAQLAEGQFL